MTMVFCLPYFSGEISVVPEQDLTFHLNRITGLSNAFEEGQILPKIYPYANYGFGYATPLFYCDIFLYPFALLYHFGLPVVICYKLCIFIYTLIGTLLIFYVSNRIFGNYKVSIVCTLVYLFANYHIQNVFVRAALGEILAMTFIPLVLLSFYEILVLKRDRYILLGISFSLLVMSHLISSLLYGILFLVLIIIFIVLNRKKRDVIKNMLLTIIKGTILAMLLCAWYLLPMFEQMMDQKFWLNANANNNNLISGAQNPLTILKMFAVSNLKGFDIVNETNLGVFTFILISLYLFIKKNNYINILLAIMFAIYMIVIGTIPTPPVLDVIQFLFRFYIVLFPLSVLIIGYNLSNIKYKYLNVILLSFILFSIYNIYLTKIFIDSCDYKLINSATIEDVNNIEASADENLDYDRDELGGAEYLPLTVNMNYKTENSSIKIIDSSGNKVEYDWNYDRNFSSILYTYSDDVDRELIFPLSYYKGYKAYEIIDNQKVSIPVYNYDLYKLVSINAESGEHMYLITYEGTDIQHFSLIISSASFVIIIIYEIIKKTNNGGTIWKK